MTNEISLPSKLKYYLYLLQRKRRKAQLEEMLLAIVLNKDKGENIIEAIEKCNISSETKKELTDWINCGELKEK